jgi:hypothetical protein
VAGIIFLKTQQIKDIESFYTEKIGMQMWLRQEDCMILRHENLLLGFCSRPEIDRSGIITFFYKTKGEVDAIYEALSDIAHDVPKMNEKYQIYHFFASDPENRVIEFQCFLHPVDL